MKKKLAAVGSVLAVGSAFAADATAPTSALVTPFIDSGKAEILAILTAGAAIVGAFFVWGLIKRALRASK